KDLVVDPYDATQSTWYAAVFSGWGGPPNRLGGLYRTIDRGMSWTRLTDPDRMLAVESVTFSPTDPEVGFVTTETQGLGYSTNIRSTSPTFLLVDNYPFMHPERVFFNPYNPNEIWITSFGTGLRVGTVSVCSVVPSPITSLKPAESGPEGGLFPPDQLLASPVVVVRGQAAVLRPPPLGSPEPISWEDSWNDLPGHKWQA